MLKKGGGPSSVDYLQSIGNPGEKKWISFFVSWLINKTPRRCFNEPRRVLKRRRHLATVHFSCFVCWCPGGGVYCQSNDAEDDAAVYTHTHKFFTLIEEEKKIQFSLLNCSWCVYSCQRTVVVVKKKRVGITVDGHHTGSVTHGGYILSCYWDYYYWAVVVFIKERRTYL